jgi:DNA-directed RNA polymerase subunit N (RpoN/RPB10)
MPMEHARCPECGASVGGEHHQAEAGVQRADDIERQFGQLGLGQ